MRMHRKTGLAFGLVAFLLTAGSAAADDTVHDVLETLVRTGDARGAAEKLATARDAPGLYGSYLASSFAGLFDEAARSATRLILQFPNSPLAADAAAHVKNLRLSTRHVENLLESLSAAFHRDVDRQMFETRLLLGSALADALVHYGDASRLKRLTRFGRIQRGWLVGPFGVTGQAGFIEGFAPEAGMHPESHFPGARVFSRPHLVESAGQFLSTPGDRGVYYLLLPVRCATPWKAVFAVSSNNRIAFFAGGRNLVSHAGGRGRIYVEVEFPEGTHALVVKIPNGRIKIDYVLVEGRPHIATDESYEALRSRERPGGRDGDATGRAWAVSSGPAARVRSAPAEQALLVQPLLAGHPDMAAIATCRLRLAHNDIFGAKEALYMLLRQRPESPVAALLEAEVFLADDSVDAATSRSIARGALDRALAAAPELAAALRRRSDVLAWQDDLLGALRDLDACQKLAPGEFVWPLERHRLLGGRGLEAQAHRALEEAVELRGDSCVPLHAQSSFLSSRQDFHRLEALADELDAGHGGLNVHRAKLLILKQDFVGAASALEEASRRKAEELDVIGRFGTRFVRLADLVEAAAALQVGDAGRLAESLQKELDEDISSIENLVNSARAAVAGLADLARRFEDSALRHRRPSSAAEMGLVATGPRPVWEELWIDPQDVLAELDAAELSAEPAWQIVDHEVCVFRGASHGVAVYHGAYVLNTKPALDKWGEVGVPGGTTLLVARTIEPDGTVILPEIGSGADRISMPALSPGCMVEFAYLSTFTASRATSGGYVHPQWFFETEDMPIALSRLDVVKPPEVRLEIRKSTGVPDPERSVLGKMELVTWQAGPSARVRPETHAAPAAERLRCISFATGAGWPAVADFYRGKLQDVRQSFDDVLRAKRILADDAPDPYEAARRLFYGLHRAVALEHWPDIAIESRRLTLPRGLGKRGALLVRALEGAGIRTEPVLTRRVTRKPLQEALPANREIERVFLRCVLPTREVFWLDPVNDYAPFDYVPPAYRGAVGLLASSNSRFVRLPERGDQASTELESVTFSEVTSERLAGSAKYVYTGWRAQNVRSALAKATVETRKRIFRNLLRPKPGQINITSSEAEPVEDPSRPLVATIRFEARGNYAADGEKIEFEQLFAPVKLSEKFITSPERKYDLVINAPIDIESDLTVLSAGELLEPASCSKGIEIPFGSFRLSITTSPHAVHVYRRIRVPVQRIRPADYDGFADFCRTVDGMEAVKFIFRAAADDVESGSAGP